MQIPKLANVERRREFDDYSHEEHVKVIKAYLFDGMSHRKIDRMVLKLDDNYTRGWQSMGILHYLGIKDPFKGIFKGMDVKDAIEQIKLTGDDSYNELLGYLSDEEISIKLCNEDVEQEKADSYCIEKEGGKKDYYVTRYERKPKLRKKAIEIHGTKCMACGFDFESFYGEQGKNYIEVHHVVPLSTVDEQVEVNPEKDMIVVCSNCHRMIHRRRNAVLTLDELKSMITIVE